MRSGFALLFFSATLLTGCSLSTTATSSPETALTVRGNVHGGQQPINGAHVYLFAANTGGYGSAYPSISLLNSASNTTKDTSGGATNNDYYVKTAADGSFSISTDYTCTAGQQVYLYALGGDPGAGPNSASGLMAILGNCPGTTFPTSDFIWINEVSTVAAAYSFAGFATDATHVSSTNTTLAQKGIANAFANAASLETLNTGVALASITNATVPQKLINTLANILASCVNSTGPTSPTCSALFTNAKSGGSTGTTATDTATAAINIAHNPGVNVATLFAIPPPTIAFAPALPTTPVPNDFTIGLNFTGGQIANPMAIAIDGSGNAWVPPNAGGGAVTEISSTGTFVSGASGYTGGGLGVAWAIAIDTVGNAWVANVFNNTISEFSNGGVPATNSPYSLGGINYPTGVAIDPSGDVWVANYSGNSLSVLSSSGTPLGGTPYSGTGGLMSPQAVAIDGNGNVWSANTGQGNVSEFTNLGVTKAGTTGYTGASGDHLQYPENIAVDGSGNAWVTDAQDGVVEISPAGSYLLTGGGLNGGGISHAIAVAIDGLGTAWIANDGNNSVTGISAAGAYVSGTSGYAGGGQSSPYGIAIDGSGNIWIANEGNSSVTELIGAAAPVVTPIAVGVANKTLGSRP